MSPVSIQKLGHGARSLNLHCTKLGNIKEDTYIQKQNFHDLDFNFLIYQPQWAS